MTNCNGCNQKQELIDARNREILLRDTRIRQLEDLIHNLATTVDQMNAISLGRPVCPVNGGAAQWREQGT